MRTYEELMTLKTFEERLKYLRIQGEIGIETFGCDRFLNQAFYNSSEWRRIRTQVIVRDNGWDMGLEGYNIPGHVYIHHMNPLTIMDIKNTSDLMFDPNYLISVSLQTHNAIHYGREIEEPLGFVERTPNDTIPWRKT